MLTSLKLFFLNYLLRPISYIAIFILALFILNEFTYFNFSLGSNNSYSSFEVIGTGKVEAVPNIATTTYTITETATNEEDARSKANTKQNQALSEIKKLGISEKDITSNIYVNPNYEPVPLSANTVEPVQDSIIYPPRQPVQNGYVATITTEIKSSDVKKINQAIDIVTEIGATVGGVSYTFDDQEKYKIEASNQAIINAREQAESMAKAGGFKLGKIISIRNADEGYPVPYGVEGALKSAAPDISTNLQPGQNQISARIGVTYEIKN